ncbi:MAG: WG repeat-containing protein [Kiritimatiellae bacterium]|nr:WG repeat-containing protein [Kiritimatiellia bacterium]
MRRCACILAAACCLPVVLCAGAADVTGAFLIVKDGRVGFVDGGGKLLASPQYEVRGSWSEGRIWVQAQSTGEVSGCFLDDRAQPLTAARYRNLSDVLPEMPLPRFARGIATVGLPGGGYGYLDRDGRMLGRTTAAGVFQRQDGDLLLCMLDGKAGFINRHGSARIPARYAEASPFRGERAAAREGTNWGLIDERGTWVAAPSFDELRWFADEPRYWSYRLGQRWGLLDRDGKRLTEARFDDFGIWHVGTVSFRAGDKWGLLAADGTERVPPRYLALTPFDQAAGLWAMQDATAKWGLLEAHGKELVACLYDEVLAPAAHVWLAQQEGQWGLLNHTNGNWLAPPRYQRVVPLNGPFDGLALTEQSACWGVVDTATGKEWMAQRFEHAQAWRNWLAVRQAGVMRLLDRDGRAVLTWEGTPEGLPASEHMLAGTGVLRTDKGVTLLAEDGTLVWSTTFDDAGEWSGELLPVRHAGRWGYADRRGQLAIAAHYETAGAFAEGFAAVKAQGRWGLIDRRGEYRVKPAFDALGRTCRGLAPAARDGCWGLIGTDGTVALPLVYDGIEWGLRAEGSPLYYGAIPGDYPSL